MLWIYTNMVVVDIEASESIEGDWISSSDTKTHIEL